MMLPEDVVTQVVERGWGELKSSRRRRQGASRRPFAGGEGLCLSNTRAYPRGRMGSSSDTMKSTVRRVLGLGVLLIVGCDQRKSAPQASSASTSLAASARPEASAAAASSPRASDSGVLDELAANVDLSGEEACIPRSANATDHPTSPTGIGSSQDGIAFCLGHNTLSQYGCFALDLASGKYKKLPTNEPPTPTKKTSVGGTHTIESLGRSVRVCPRRGGDCNTIATGAYRTEKLPFDVSPDGKKLIVVRETGARLTVDIYDVATGAREKETGIEDRGELVGPVWWPGQRAVVVACTASGSGCTPILFDPETQTSTSVAVNVYATERPLHRVTGSTWAFVDSTGSDIATSDVNTGAKSAGFKSPIVADRTAGVAVIPREASKIAIVAGSKQAGTVALIDLQSGKLVKTFTPTICK